MRSRINVLHWLERKMMPNTEEELKSYNEIAELKEKLHKHDKAIARIERWHKSLGQQYVPQGWDAEKETLETVLRIFKEGAER